MSRYLEVIPLRRFHYLILIVLGLGWAFDAMCAGLISATTPLIQQEWGLTASQLGMLLSCWLAGMLLGGLTMGYLADVIGRKKATLLTLLLYSIPTSVATFSLSPESMALLRLLAGMGSSGYMVVASTLLSEYVPARYRGRFVAFLESSWAFGWLLSVYLGRVLAPYYGWRSVFSTGAIPLLTLPLVALLVPESVRYLEERGEIEAIERIFRSLGIRVNAEEVLREAHGRRVRAKFVELFSAEYRKRTVMLWIHWFCIVLAYWGIFLWLPKILYDRGLSLVRSLDFTVIITLMQVPGYWSGALLIDRVGRKPVLSTYMMLAGLGSLLFAIAGNELEVLVWGSMISFFNLGAWGATYAYTPELYPTRARGTGAGSANSVGRIGGMVGPYAVGALLDLTGGNTYPVFVMFTIVHLVSAITVMTLGIETKGRALEEISG